MNKLLSRVGARQRVLEVITFLGTPPFYLILCVIIFSFSSYLALIYLVAVAATEFVCAVIKLSTRTERPTPRKRKTLYDQYDASTFPSAHTGRIASNMSVLMVAYPNIFSIVIGFVTVYAVAYSRIALKEHYLADVIVGALVGIVVSFFIYIWLS